MRERLHTLRRATGALPWRQLAPPAEAFALTAAALGGQYAPWALAVVAVAGAGWQGLSAVIGAGLGAWVFLDFQPGLRHCAAAILILCANTALCTAPLYRHPRFRPLMAVSATALVQLAYLWQRGVYQYALFAAALALLYGCTSLWREEDGESGLFCLLLGLCGGVSRVSLEGFSPAVVCAAALLLAAVCCREAAESASLGALTGLTLDLCGGGTLYATVVLCAAVYTASLLRKRQRLVRAMAFCAAGLCGAWLLGETRPLALLCELVAGCGVWLLLPEKVYDTAPRRMECAPAAAFQAVYECLPQSAPLLRPENPAVLFDRAAEQVCRDCPLRTDCWQSHYTDTYNAFNDASPRLLCRGKPLPEDFPPYFAARCVRFPRLLAALEGQVRDYLMRRASHAKLDAAYRLAREQYAQVSQALLHREEESDAPSRYVCRLASGTRPRRGETLCGDAAECFAVGDRTYLLLSDGMGSGESAHNEAAMTVRLLRQFLTAGIEPLPALKTLNTALTLRCQTGSGFTTIDLACVDGVSGTATLYKYGAAASYLKRGGAVTALRTDTFPAGLESAQCEPPPRRVALSHGCWLVLVSDGVTAEGDEWLQDLLAGWDGASPRELVGHVLRQAEERCGGGDDCAVIAVRVERCAEGRKRV